MSLPNFNQMNPFFGSLEDLLSPVTFASTPPANSPPELTFADLESILNNSNSPPFGITTASGPVFPFPETADDFNFNFGSESPDPTDFFETILSRPLPNSPHSNSPHPSPSMTDSASEPEGSKKVVPGKRGRKKKELTLEQQEEKSKERLMKNREAAQQSRDKKRKYMDDLESTNLTLAKRLVTLETQNQTLLTRLEEMAMQMTEMRGLMQGSSRGIGSGRDDRKFISNLADSTNQSSKSWSVYVITSLFYPNFGSSASSAPKKSGVPVSTAARDLLLTPAKKPAPDASFSTMLAEARKDSQWMRIGQLIPPSAKADLVRPWWLVAHKSSVFPNLGLLRSKMYGFVNGKE